MILLAEDAEQVCLVVVRRLEQIHTLQHFDLTRGTARAAARKGDGCPHFIADIEQVTALGSIDDLGSARAASFELYLRHVTRCSERTPAEQPGFGQETSAHVRPSAAHDRRRLAALLLKPCSGLLGNDPECRALPRVCATPAPHGKLLRPDSRMLTFEHGGATIAPMGWV